MPYIALVKSSAVRAETCSVDPAGETAASHWTKKEGAELYIGVFQGCEDAEIRAKAAAKADVLPSSIRLVELVGV